jgi:hypothetical protein
MRTIVLVLSMIGLMAIPALASVSFFDDFEAGVGGTHAWYNWATSGATWPPPNPSGINNLLTTSTDHNHTLGGSKSAREWASDPAAWNAYSDFGVTSGRVVATVWVFEDLSNPGTNPITNMLALYGAGANPGVFSDYLYLGIQSNISNTTYSIRSSTGGFVNTGVARHSGWTQLKIDASTGAGGVLFYIDGAPVGSATRTGVDLQYVRLGNNAKSYENFWYDDLSIVPEPASALLLLLGLPMLRRKSR